jgi:hypothetical protein
MTSKRATGVAEIMLQKVVDLKQQNALNVQKIGHIASVCRSKTSKDVKPGSTSKHGQADRDNIQNVSLYDSNKDNVNSESDELGIYSLYSVG